LIAAKKNKAWLGVAGILSGSRRKMVNLNLNEIDKQAKENEIIVVPGKVLSLGEISNKLKVVALSFSEKAKEKLLKSNCEVSDIINEIKKNPKAKGVKILKRESKILTCSNKKEVNLNK